MAKSNINLKIKMVLKNLPLTPVFSLNLSLHSEKNEERRAQGLWGVFYELDRV